MIMMRPMMKKNLTSILVCALAALTFLVTPALAQSPGAPADAVGSTFVKATHGAWEIRCLRIEDGSERCQMYQRLSQAGGNPIAEINLFALPPGQNAVAGAVIVTPLETLLPARLGLTIDSAEGKKYPFSWCTVNGCVARIGFTAPELNQLKSGIQATVTIVPVTSPNNPVALPISLQGFTAGFAEMQAANPAP